MAGIGIIAARKNAKLLHKDVRSIVTPIRFRHSPVSSWQQHRTQSILTELRFYVPLDTK